MIIQQDTLWLLTQWALWRFLGMGAKSINPIARMMAMMGENYKESSTRERCLISDDTAESVDKIMAKLMIRNPESYNALDIYLSSGCNMSYTARKLKIRRDKTEPLVAAGISWVDSRVCDLEIA